MYVLIIAIVTETTPPETLVRDMKTHVPNTVALERTRRKRYRRHLTPTAKLAAQVAVLTNQLKTQPIAITRRWPTPFSCRDAEIQCDLLEGPPLWGTGHLLKATLADQLLASGLVVKGGRRRMSPKASVAANEDAAAAATADVTAESTAITTAAVEQIDDEASMVVQPTVSVTKKEPTTPTCGAVGAVRSAGDGCTLSDGNDSDDEWWVDVTPPGESADSPIMLSDGE